MTASDVVPLNLLIAIFVDIPGFAERRSNGAEIWRRWNVLGERFRVMYAIVPHHHAMMDKSLAEPLKVSGQGQEELM